MSSERSKQPHRIEVAVSPFDDPDTLDVYANVTGVGTTAHDVVLLFAQAVPLEQPPSSGKITLKPRLRVTMSPEAVRHLATQLVEQLATRDEALAKLRQAVSGDAT